MRPKPSAPQDDQGHGSILEGQWQGKGHGHDETMGDMHDGPSHHHSPKIGSMKPHQYKGGA